MREFKEIFEELGYIFPSEDVLEDIYLFYKYYNNKANKGVSAILLEGASGCGKTFLSEIFSKFLGVETEYIYTKCVEETNSDKLINIYNVPAIFIIAERILTRAINLANMGKKVVLTIDDLDKEREIIDSYFLDFLQNGKIKTLNNKILSLTEEGIKNLYVILTKSNKRNLLDTLLRICSVVKIPPMSPVLVCKILLRKFENIEHDPRFLKFVSKVYEAIYNEQMNSKEELLSRLPSIQELITAITSDKELYENGISSIRRINNLIRKLGKDTESRGIITNIIMKKFKSQNKESNYTNETILLNMNILDYYMSIKDADSLVEQYIEEMDDKYIFEENEFEDPIKDIASILDNLKDDQTLAFLDKENKEKIVELGVITHLDSKTLKNVFEEVKFKGNPNSRFGFLNFEGDNFLGLMKYKNTLILIANKEYVYPRLLMKGLCTLITIIYYFKENIDRNFKLAGLNVKILSNIPDSVLKKMSIQNGVYNYQISNMKITYDDSLNISYFRYLQKYESESLYETIEKICGFNPELAITASFIHAKTFNKSTYKNFVRKLSDFESEKKRWEMLRLDGWEIQIEDFIPMNLSYVNMICCNNNCEDGPKKMIDEDSFVFKWKVEKDEDKKRLHVYPKYKLKGKYLLYISDEDFENDSFFKQLDPFQREIAFIARNIFGNFIPQYSDERNPNYFSALTMFQTGKILEDENNRNTILGISQDITREVDFTNYYDSLSQSSEIITLNKALKRTLK